MCITEISLYPGKTGVRNLFNQYVGFYGFILFSFIFEEKSNLVSPELRVRVISIS